MDSLPKISVVIPIRNEERYIATTLEHLQKQDYPHDLLEMVVVDGQSDDRTVEIVKEMAVRDNRIKLFFNPRRLSSAARNIGAQKASGEIVLYIDGHIYIDNNFLLKNIAYYMKEKDVSVLSRPGFLETPGNCYFQNAVALARKSPFGHGLDSTIFDKEDRYVDPESSAAFYRREVIAEVGYFDEAFDAAEDYEFNYRLRKSGYRSFTSPKLGMFYYPRDSFGRLFQQATRYGIGRCRLIWKHPEAFSLGVVIPAGFILGLPTLLLLSLLISEMIYPAIGLYGLYLIINLISSIYIAATNGWKYLPILPGIFLTIHSGLGWGFVKEMVRNVLVRFKIIRQRKL